MNKVKEWFKDNWKNLLLIVYVFTIIFGLSFTAFYLTYKKNKEVLSQAGIKQTWQSEQFTFSYDDLDEYDCFLLEEKEHIYVKRENAYIVYTDDDFNDYSLSYEKIAIRDSDFVDYYLKEEYKLYFYIGVYK